MATSIASGGADWMGDPHWLEQCKVELKTAIRTRFLQIKDRLDTVVYSLIRTRDFDLADELYLRLTEDGCSFEELAHFSEGPERGWGAQVGPCPLNQGHPELVYRLKSWSTGELKQPFAIRSTAILLRVNQRYGARFTDWENQIACVLAEEMGLQPPPDSKQPTPTGQP